MTRSSPPRLPRWAISVLAVLAAAGLGWLLAPWVGAESAYLLFTVAVMLSARYGGIWSGLAATLLGGGIVLGVFVSSPGSPAQWLLGRGLPGGGHLLVVPDRDAGRQRRLGAGPRGRSATARERVAEARGQGGRAAEERGAPARGRPPQGRLPGHRRPRAAHAAGRDARLGAHPPRGEGRRGDVGAGARRHPAERARSRPGSSPTSWTSRAWWPGRCGSRCRRWSWWRSSGPRSRPSARQRKPRGSRSPRTWTRRPGP